jgi:hypothetical protein
MGAYIGAREFAGYKMRQQNSAGVKIAAFLKRKLASNSYRLGSALNRLAVLPNMQLVPAPVAPIAAITNDIVGRSGNYKPPMGAKGTQERANYMAWLRSERKGGRRTKKQITQANLIKRARFGLPRAYQGRPKKTVSTPAPAPVRDIASILNRARFGKARRYAGGRPRGMSAPAPAVVAAAASPTVVPASAAPSTVRRGRPRKITAPSTVSAVASVVPKKRGRPAKVITMGGGMMSIPRAVSTGNGAAARKGRPRKLTTDTARLVKDVVRLQKQGKSTKSITYGILTGSKGTAGKRGRPGKIVSDTARVVRDVVKLRGVKRR